MSQRDLTRPETADDGAPEGRKSDAARRARRLSRVKGEMPVAPTLDGPQQTRSVVAELESPVPRGGIVGVVKQPYLLRLLVQRQLAQQYAASLLGFLWSYIQPAFRFAIYFVIFGVVFKLHEGTPNFAIHLFCGIVLVHYFSETVNGGVRSIWTNRALVQKMKMPREIFPVSAMLVAGYHTVPQLLLLMVICIAAGFSVSWTAVAALLLSVAILVLFSTALALLLAAFNVYYRDFQNIVGTFLQMIHFMVPMMYPLSRIQELGKDHPVLLELYLANPVAQAVLLAQRFFWYGVNKSDGGRSLVGGGLDQYPSDMFPRALITLAACAVLLWVCQRVFTRLESKFPERI